MPEALLFSVIIPTYNRANWLKNSIASVLGQTYTNWELLIVDDGSTDNTREVVKKNADPRIKYFFQENKNRSAARNAGASKARGEYLCFLDDDDEFMPNHLETLAGKVNALDHPVTVFRTGLLLKTGTSLIKTRNYRTGSPLRFVVDHFLNLSSFCFHRQICETHHFPEAFFMFEDKHFLLRALADYPLIQLAPYTALCHDHEERTVARAFLSEKAVDNQIACMNDLFTHHLPLLKNHAPLAFWHKKISIAYLNFSIAAAKNRNFPLARKYLLLAWKNKAGISLLKNFTLTGLLILKERLKSSWK